MCSSTHVKFSVFTELSSVLTEGAKRGTMSNSKDTLTRVADMDLTRDDPPAPGLALARQYLLASPKAFLFPFFC